MTEISRELKIYSLEGTRYGVWKDEIPAIKPVQGVHWLPPVPRHIAGMAIVEGKTSALFDLSACLGRESISQTQGDYLMLVMEQGKNLNGFITRPFLGSIFIETAQVYPMPDFLATHIMDACVLHENQLIPVLNIARLFAEARKEDYEPGTPDLRFDKHVLPDTLSDETVRLFSSGSGWFGFPGIQFEKKHIKESPITSFSGLPGHILGLAFYRGRIIPVISFKRLLGKDSETDEEVMLAGAIGDLTFGVMVDEDLGSRSFEKKDLKKLPPVARKDWMQKALLFKEHIIPMIDAAAILSAEALDLSETADFSKEYTTATDAAGFGKLYKNEDVSILEYYLNGQIHALPDSEAGRHIPVVSFRRIPNTMAIVRGVAKYEGDLVPVIDLLACFGKRSPLNRNWRMIPIARGDFKALVLTDQVVGIQRLNVKLHRDLPFEPEFDLAYGCYPIGDSVGLILNIAALVIYFNRMTIKNLLNVFTGHLGKDTLERQNDPVPDDDADTEQMEMFPGPVMPPFANPDERVGGPGEVHHYNHLPDGEPSGDELSLTRFHDPAESGIDLFDQREPHDNLDQAQSSVHIEERTDTPGGGRKTEPDAMTTMTADTEEFPEGPVSQDLKDASAATNLPKVDDSIEASEPSGALEASDTSDTSDMSDTFEMSDTSDTSDTSGTPGSLVSSGLETNREAEESEIPPAQTNHMGHPVAPEELMAAYPDIEDDGSNSGGSMGQNLSTIPTQDGFQPVKPDKPTSQPPGNPDLKLKNTKPVSQPETAIPVSASDETFHAGHGWPDEEPYCADRASEIDEVRDDGKQEATAMLVEQENEKPPETRQGSEDCYPPAENDLPTTLCVVSSPSDQKDEGPPNSRLLGLKNSDTAVWDVPSVDPVDESPEKKETRDFDSEPAFKEKHGFKAAEKKMSRQEVGIRKEHAVESEKKRSGLKWFIAALIALLMLTGGILFSETMTRYWEKWARNSEILRSVQSVRLKIMGKPDDKIPKETVENDARHSEKNKFKKNDSNTETVTHNVKKGDTLYNITREYTGDGYQYPKVAEENQIENPDLIYPKQKIQIEMKKKKK